MSETAVVSEKLKESVVKRALKTLEWAPFERHLATVDLDQQGVAELVAHVRHSSDILLKRQDPKRKAARAEFVEALAKHLSDHVSS
jgi:hypothetical protein